MASLHVLVPVLLVLFLSIASTKDLPLTLTPFAKLLKSALPKEAYNELFGYNFKDQATFVKCVATYTETFPKTLGQKTPPEIAKEFEAEAKREASKINQEALFAVYSNSVGNTLKDQKKLTSENRDKLAKKLAEELKKTADAFKPDDLFPICAALGKTTAEFFKSLDLSSKNVLVNYEKNLLAEKKKV